MEKKNGIQGHDFALYPVFILGGNDIHHIHLHVGDLVVILSAEPLDASLLLYID